MGMTATPKRRDNVDTHAYFGDPVYIYSLKDGINDGFLTPFKVKQISTTLDEYVATGVDARNIRNIVLMRPINTMIEFKQIDVLAHVAYALPPVTREERAGKAKVIISTRFNSKQQIFLDFVLSHYVSVGVEELDQEKLTPLLRLMYHDSIADAVADLGRPDEIGKVFAGFQKYLYRQQAAA
ncbi:MAG: hypothetical protein A3G34_08380 [Candidatus Lindowbacteria bacterium RIFCSPLOWO2_12_FULL_62_27]|nr:MAG: hypothetical protein A3G34_08380 [Candidatus Lindowbacteria bacterium RIFCSPLOWO2_12_FULL_62_27]OGH62917.1 MAG: hypothetical protein A3I06_13625 [Candidatus Lindowbacteria bacterium RIFCSPLOWO2_02_FULL_62_12]